MHHSTDRIAHTTAFVTPVLEHWLEREIAQWVHHTKDRSDDPSHHERTPLPRSYISLPHLGKTWGEMLKWHLVWLRAGFTSWYLVWKEQIPWFLIEVFCFPAMLRHSCKKGHGMYYLAYGMMRAHTHTPQIPISPPPPPRVVHEVVGGDFLSCYQRCCWIMSSAM